ncbi:MAG: hypothetical protein J6K75_00820 [Erysipelotrichaceae bacterium]|nr:hypothetical protein [Erysipelotrichaceae bacterium]
MHESPACQIFWLCASYTECAFDLVKLKKEKEFLKEVDSISLQLSLRHLDTAYKNFLHDLFEIDANLTES